jgi:hypothetical protein
VVVVEVLEIGKVVAQPLACDSLRRTLGSIELTAAVEPREEAAVAGCRIITRRR